MKPTPLLSILLALASSQLLLAEPAILTPKPPAEPRINGPKISGVRPGSPFLYSIPATGERPMNFSAKGLPDGLKLDSATGRISGKLDKPGTHEVVLSAKNSRGTVERPLRIVVGETIALTPPMGWNSWNCWGGRIDQEKTLAAAKAIVRHGLDQHGWTYVNIDDAWQGRRGGPYQAIQPDSERFPDMKGLCDEIHGMGLKVGIYSSPWVTTYARRIGGSSENENGDWTSPGNGPKTVNKKILPWAIGKYHFAEKDAKQWAEWGIDYLKYDWNPIEVPETAEMDKALRASGRDVVLSLSNSTPFQSIGELSPLANCWRTTGDIKDTWDSMWKKGFNGDKWARYQKPGHFNDPDMLVVGQVGWGKPHPTNLTPDEQYTHISIWSLLSAPLLLGCDLEKMDDFTLSLLTNDEVIAVNQDSLCKQALKVSEKDKLIVFAKQLEDGSRAVGLFNLGDKEETVSVKWQELGLSGSQAVRDLWRQKDLGALPAGFEAPVASHGVVLVKVGPAH
ncbi:putative Ig domain-containing protein [Haloferula sp. BvORR071]|uniref:putative Ig domain-containing protein n=1 Tax=Haloferula sp. BvORR071 TaxID=1396141 RepID=UPI00054FF6C7|nr:putative Ig domain-containing protein [Haloferula sp. BvORR071]